MMNNLFSMFDPSTSYLFSMNWLSLLILIIFAPRHLFNTPSRFTFLFNSMLKMMNLNTSSNLNKIQFKSLSILMTLYIFILLSNLISLIPFVFNSTSQPSTCLSLSLPLWLSFTIKNWTKNLNSALTHLLPHSTPLFLCPFMITIEIISLLIRPITLTIRLTANMIAGHILVTLLSLMLTNYLSFIPSSITMNLLMTLEIAVAIIQSYVFVILMSLYLNEST